MASFIRMLPALSTVAVIGIFGPAPAFAATAATTIVVSATVLSFCNISASPLAFGNYSSAALSATTTVTTNCTLGTTFNVGLDNGSGTGASTATRKMSYLTNTLTYGLYSDASHSVAIGTTVGTNTVSGTGTGALQTTTIYGFIPAGQTVAPGAYADTVTASIYN